MTNVRAEVWSSSRMLSASEGVVSPQTTAGFTQRDDMQQTERENEKEIRPSPLNIYALGPHRFLATFFALFRGGWGVGGLVLGDPHTFALQACMSGHRYVQIFTQAFTLPTGNEGKKGL